MLTARTALLDATMSLESTLDALPVTVTVHRYEDAGFGPYARVNAFTRLPDQPDLDGLSVITTLTIYEDHYSGRVDLNDPAAVETETRRRVARRLEQPIWHHARGVQWTPLREPDGPIPVDAALPTLDSSDTYRVRITDTQGDTYTVEYDSETGSGTAALGGGRPRAMIGSPRIKPGHIARFTWAHPSGPYVKEWYTTARIVAIEVLS